MPIAQQWTTLSFDKKTNSDSEFWKYKSMDSHNFEYALVTLKLLSKASADDQIDTPKYKCIVSLDFTQSIAKQLDLDMAEYLYAM